MRDMVKAVYPEAVARRESVKLKVAATKDLHALVFYYEDLAPALLEVRFNQAFMNSSHFAIALKARRTI